MEDLPKNLQFVECQNCGTIHYMISADEAKALNESGELYDEFSNRNLKCCSNCGYKNHFVTVSENYVDDYLHGGKIPPILIDDEQTNGATEKTESN